MNKPIKQSNPLHLVSTSSNPIAVMQQPGQERDRDRSDADFCRSALPANRGLYYDGDGTKRNPGATSRSRVLGLLRASVRSPSVRWRDA